MLAAVLLAAALLLQLTVLNRLHLPGGGVPDLMLVLVASLAIATARYPAWSPDSPPGCAWISRRPAAS